MSYSECRVRDTGSTVSQNRRKPTPKIKTPPTRHPPHTLPAQKLHKTLPTPLPVKIPIHLDNIVMFQKLESCLSLTILVDWLQLTTIQR